MIAKWVKEIRTLRALEVAALGALPGALKTLRDDVLNALADLAHAGVWVDVFVFAKDDTGEPFVIGKRVKIEGERGEFVELIPPVALLEGSVVVMVDGRAACAGISLGDNVLATGTVQTFGFFKHWARTERLVIKVVRT